MRAWFTIDDATCFSVCRRMVACCRRESVRVLGCLILTLLTLTGCKTTSPRAESAQAEPTLPEPVVVEEVLAPEPIVPAKPELAKPEPAPVPVPIPAPKPAEVAKPKPVVPRKTVLSVGPNYRWTHVVTDGPYIALTFDDGPNPKNTPAMLDVLKQRQIPATFFVLGQNAAAYPSILKRMAAEGHEIATHGWNHASFMKLTPEERIDQVRKTNKAIQDATSQTPHLIRPPYGATTPDLNRWFTEDMKMHVILWSVDSRDWEYRDSARIQREILTTTKPGSIILSHDIHRITVSAMPATLDALLAKGYKFVTVSDLISMASPR